MADKVLGSGNIYFEPEDASGNLGGGEEYFAETPVFNINATPTLFEDYTSDGRMAERDFAVTTQMVRGGQIQCKDMRIEILAYFWPGSVQTVTQTATPVLDEPFTAVQADRWYQLGRSLANPTGVRNVSSVTITGPGGTPSHVAGTDYELDAVMARFRPIAGGGMAGNDVLVDYTPAANSRKRLVSDQLGPKSGALHFIADNTGGANKDIWIPKVQLMPEGDLAFKSRDTLQIATFTLNIGTRAGYAQIYADGRPV